jgi:hypothetical protein
MNNLEELTECLVLFIFNNITERWKFETAQLEDV